MDVLRFNCYWLLTILMLTDLRLTSSSPVLLPSDFEKSKPDKLPTQRNEQRRNLFPLKHDSGITTPRPPSKLDNLADLQQGEEAKDIDFKPWRARKSSDLPPKVRSSIKYGLMQLKQSLQTPKRNLLLKKQTSNAFKMLLKEDRGLGAQHKDNNPVNPKVQSEQGQNSILAPQLVGHTNLPLQNGLSLINLGHIDLKPDACRAYSFKEKIRHRGCNNVTIENNMCYGQCNSFYIPKRFVSCSYCAPSRMEIYEIRLECPGQNPDFVLKKVPIVKECACKDCGLEHP
ncbi:PREDICTED: uncharacterized protein LOC107347779 [Acropora digitifera]|uniref:Cer/NST-like 1 protein n=1 Tax=Acropora digitifera TaxID=70779 RepID=A0A0A8K9Z6_ACRDI|nr:PREDICTED: uncharacterized protein LOC107347779 [Acropora digitifera]XP_015769242.1 PREDICTED: uncharacterized protein LOC107347779 [Acropora digitifera]XP_015769249.1 PREDICTED: uncharacterized protein LOC107347779 [Acropora digitifera]XP_015769258.1 PREDICTED: uncharacterized protein LOC107347779 [Acropora digitifera]XP_015769263.1 PREDICTED: uncharacterized protein LOC107347779 [Acropora digitifera]BAQ19138.1 Cer/NST-like 1 protein [Acropora digitifera]